MILLHHMSVTSGSLSTMLDTYLNLKEAGLDPELVVRWSISGSPIRKAKRLRGEQRGLDKLEEAFRHTNCALHENTGEFIPWRIMMPGDEISCGTVVTTMKYFADCVREGLEPSLACGKLIVLDTWDIERMYWDGDLGKALSMAARCSKELVFMCNPATAQRIPGATVVTYYHRINKARLDRLRQLSKDDSKVLVRHPQDAGDLKAVEITNEDYHSPTYLDKAFSAGTYRYRRHGQKGKMPYMYENVGKLMYEYALTGRRVEYSPEGKGCDDGLTHYLRRLGIDDSKGFVLAPGSLPLEKMIFSPEDDALVSILRGESECNTSST